MRQPALPRGRRTSAAVLAGSTLAAVVLGAVPANAATTYLGYDAVKDKGSLFNVAEVVGAHGSYASGVTGRGVGVALVDTGVSPVAGLTSGNVVTGPDLSFDSQDRDAAHVDGFGHGTHLASIIAGRDVAGAPSSYANADRFNGIAPDSTLVNVKVGASNGAVDVTQVIAGIDWTVEHAKDPGLNIRVINLSYGTDSLQSSSVDPLAYAVENAWKHGIVVVVAGGNEGETTQNLANPASDPFVIAVGAMDDAGTVSRSDDTVPTWSTHGTDARHVDVVAPGVSVLGLRVPGGTADAANPEARVGDRFARASGTSQAAAVVSGEVALLLQAYPLLTPDQVKGVITGSASGVAKAPVKVAGAGMIDVLTAQKLPKAPLPLPLPIPPAIGWGRGTGSLEASRGSSHVSNGSSQLTGEVDLFGRAWNGAAWAKATSAGNAWTDGTWRGESLTGTAWNRGVWPTTTWAGNDWSGVSYTSDQWSARTWRDDSWSARTWRDDSWSARTWRDEGWR